MRVVLAVAALVLLGACETEGEKAERAYRNISHGNYEAACRAAKNAHARYTEEGNTVKAEQMARTAEGECGTVQMLNEVRRER